jgi:hypothetical protein
MTQPTPTPTPEPEGATLAEELAAIPYEPLLPVEKKLIAGSLILGFALLGVLLWASSTFFPIAAVTK